MKDTIYREDAIATIGVMYERCDTYDIIDYRDLMLEAVKVLPSADRPQEWIPCSERLPKKEKATYLICTEDGYMCSCRWTNDMYGIGSNEWSKWGWHIMDKPQYAKVVAWMSLKPWKGADDE